MAVKVYKTGNILVIDDGVKKKYPNSGWVSIDDFSATAVELRFNDKPSHNTENPLKILFTDFQNEAGTGINTEATIFAYLAPLIG